MLQVGFPYQKPLSPKPVALSYGLTTAPHSSFRWVGAKDENDDVTRHLFRIRPGEVESNALTLASVESIDPIRWSVYVPGMASGFTFVLPEEMIQLSEGPVDIGDSSPVASLSGVEKFGDHVHSFRVSVPPAHDEELMVFYEFGRTRNVDVELDICEDTVHGGGYGQVPADQMSVDFEVDLSETVPMPLELPFTFYVSLAERMASSPYQVSEDDHLVQIEVSE